MDCKKTCIVILVITLVFIYFYWNVISAHKEKFSTSGFSISDIDCEKLAFVYGYPHNKDTINKICGMNRRKNVYNNTGNYYTVNGQLI